jgi:archaellum component FlaC
MALDKNDIKQIKEAVVEAVDPYFAAIQKDFSNVNDRLERIEKLILADHKRRIEKLENEVKELKELLAVR